MFIVFSYYLWAVIKYIVLKFYECVNLIGKRVVKGSIIGGMKETQDMLNFCGKHNITCEIETVTPDRINEALTRLANNDVKYRFVINIAGKNSSL